MLCSGVCSSTSLWKGSHLCVVWNPCPRPLAPSSTSASSRGWSIHRWEIILNFEFLKLKFSILTRSDSDPDPATSGVRIRVYNSVLDPQKFSCRSGSRIPKMSIWIRIQGGKHKWRKLHQIFKTKYFKMTLKNHYKLINKL